jgi:hypothetical protein
MKDSADARFAPRRVHFAAMRQTSQPLAIFDEMRSQLKCDRTKLVEVTKRLTGCRRVGQWG